MAATKITLQEVAATYKRMRRDHLLDFTPAGKGTLQACEQVLRDLIEMSTISGKARREYMRRTVHTYQAYRSEPCDGGDPVLGAMRKVLAEAVPTLKQVRLTSH